MASLSLPSAGAEPFTITVLDDELANLQRKLALTTLPDELDDAGWAYGVPLADVSRLLARWKAGFDWRAQEAALNADLPQFRRKIEVDGHGALGVHFIHQRSTVEGAVPLLFVHGCESPFVLWGGVVCRLTEKCRAGRILGGAQDLAAAHAGDGGPAELSRCGVQSAWVWVL